MSRKLTRRQIMQQMRDPLRLMASVCRAGAKKMRLGAEICRFANAPDHARYLLEHAEMLERLANQHCPEAPHV